MGLLKIDRTALMAVVNCLAQIYRYRPRKTVILNTTLGTKMLWKICKPFLGETTTKKTFLESDSTSDELTNNFHPSQLEEKFGGTAPNVEGPYWPPVFP